MLCFYHIDKHQTVRVSYSFVFNHKIITWISIVFAFKHNLPHFFTFIQAVEYIKKVCSSECLIQSYSDVSLLHQPCVYFHPIFNSINFFSDALTDDPQPRVFCCSIFH